MTQNTNDIYSENDIKMIKAMIDPENKYNKEQVDLFLHVCKEKGLDPREKLIWAVPRWNGKTGKNDLTIQVSIDGFRLIADRTGKYAPGKPTVYHYTDKHQLTGATVFVKKFTVDGTWHEVSATAFLSEYKPAKGSSFWNRMPSVMIEKVAESRALRRAFPGDFSGLYSEDEMAQSKNKSEHKVEQVEELPEPPKPKEVISEKQAKELDDVLGSDVKYRQAILNFIKEAHCLDSFVGMPVESFERAIKVAKKRAAERAKLEQQQPAVVGV